MQIIKDNIYTRLVKCDKELLSLLVKKYSFKIPNAYFASKGRGGWNGTQQFITKGGRLGTGIIDEVLDDLSTVNAQYTLKDNTTSIPSINRNPLPGVTLRHYQESALSAIERNNFRGIIKAPTGSGKTLILASVANYFKDSIGVIFFTKKQILFQTYKEFQKLGIDCGIVCGEANDIKPITLCTIQSVDKILDSHVDHAEFILYDEIHEFGKGKLSKSCLKSFKKAAVRLGFSATPPKEITHDYSVRSFLGPLIYDLKAAVLIEEGFLAKPKIKVVTAKEPAGYTSEVGVPYPEVYNDFIINNKNRNKQICDIVDSYEEGRFLILTKNLEHAHILKDLIPNSFQLEGKDSLLTRRQTIEDFKTKNKKTVLIGTVILQTGVDIPEITHFINARGMKSEIATIQAIGRSLRISEGKTEATIFDFYDDAMYLASHSKKRLKHYKSEDFDIENYEN
jgi:superfamily II DNA or RNA helicase